jgi:hypothetical protein
MNIFINRSGRKLFHLSYLLFGRFKKDSKVHLVTECISTEQFNNIKTRLDYYLPGKMLISHSNWPFKEALSGRPLLIFGDLHNTPKWLTRFCNGLHDIDYRQNHMDSWAWIDLVNSVSSQKTDIKKSKQNFKEFVDSLKTLSLKKAYIFGTGPSLEQASNRDWSDGYRIVCNTIVRDAGLWNYINPHFIVAGDAIYHFGHTEYARSFRKDLMKRLDETETYFLYPAYFDVIVRRELIDFKNRLIPVPIGNRPSICNDLCINFELPSLGNVLPLLMLPIACTLSKRVYLWGFDGRAPNDKLFWSNSAKHSYPEFVPGLQKAHPAFFDHYVPKENPTQYVQQVQGDVLDKQMKIAEERGWTFIMMHNSWTPTLQKRSGKINNSS